MRNEVIDIVKPANPKRNILMCLAAVLLCLTMLSLYLVSGLSAKYTAGEANSEGARAAAFVFDVNDITNHFIDVSTVNAPGKQADFWFSVTNRRGSVVSETAKQYQISAAIHGSLPLTAAITDASNTEVITLDTSVSDLGTSNIMTFQAGQTATHTYRLTVQWPEDEKDLQYANAGLEEIELSISAWQVD